MAKTTHLFAGTTSGRETLDILDDAFRSLRIAGSLLLRESYSAPWAVTVPRAGQLGALLGLPQGTRAVAFHLVEYGHCEITPEGGERVLLAAGDLAICFGGQPHRLSAGRTSRAQRIDRLLASGKNLQRPEFTGRSADAALTCGVFLLHHADFNPLVVALPAVVHTTLTRSGELHNLAGVARLLSQEIDRARSKSSYVIERLLEVLCAEAVRAYAESAPDQVGWFRGINDPVVGRALTAVHANPGEAWSVSRMADEVPMSPSRFAARFTAALGISPMVYVARWRMNVACRKLVSTRGTVDQVASALGYESPAAFNRAFKKLVGLPPSAWRERERRSVMPRVD